MIPKDRLSITTYSSVIKKVESQLRDILIEPIRRDEIEPFQNVKRIYRSCMKTEITNLTSRDFFKVERAPSNHTRKSWPFQKASKNTTEGGLKVDSFFSTGVTINSKNPSRRIIFVSFQLIQTAKWQNKTRLWNFRSNSRALWKTSKLLGTLYVSGTALKMFCIWSMLLNKPKLIYWISMPNMKT